MFDNFPILTYLGVLLVISILCSILMLYTNSEVTCNRRLSKQQVRVIESCICNMDPREFEIFVSKLFQFKGYKTKLTPATNDHGKDVIVYGYKNNEVTYVECKHYSEHNQVGREIINKLMGACTLDGVKSAIIVTTSGYKKTAYDCLKKCSWIELWDTTDLIDIIKEMNELQLMKWFNIVIDKNKIIRT